MKIALASTNPIKIDGVRKGFMSHFKLKKDVEVFSYEVPSRSTKKIKLGEKLFTTGDTKLKDLKQLIDHEVDYNVATQDGLLCYSGKWFYVQAATIQKSNSRCECITGLSSSIQVPTNLIMEILNEDLEESEFLNFKRFEALRQKFVEEAVISALEGFEW